MDSLGFIIEFVLVFAIIITITRSIDRLLCLYKDAPVVARSYYDNISSADNYSKGNSHIVTPNVITLHTAYILIYFMDVLFDHTVGEIAFK